MREIKPPRIAILDCNNSPLAFMDCSSHGSLDYWNDELHEYLEGTSTTLTLTSSARHSDSLYLVEGNKLAFEYNGKDYYLNIMKTVRTELTVEIEAWSVNLELLNEVKLAYDSPNAQTFEQYLNRFDPEHTVKLGLNEVSDKKLKLKWTGEDTILARLYSLANNFDAEIEFLPELNDDYSLKQIVINVYRKHDENHQGIGKANSLNLRYGSDIDGVTKTTDITDLYTCIRPYGKTDSKTNKKLDLSGLKKTEYDKDGNVEYFVEGSLIRAPQARDRFPSNLVTGDRYIVQNWNCDTDNKEMLYGRALAELKKNCTPRVTYEIDGFADTGIGDTVRITDEEYNPVLYIDARVTEQIRSFTDPLRNKTTFSNVEVLQNQVSDSLLQSVQELIAQNKTYIGQISTTNGVQFVNGTGSTTLTAIVLDGVIEVTDNYTINWKKDGQTIGTGKSITINATDFTGKAVISFEATNTEGVVISKSEATLTSVRDGVDGQNGRDGQNGKDGLNGKDGEKGEQGIPGPKGEDGKDGANGKDGKTTYFHIKYSPVQNPTSAQLTETPSTYIGTYVDFVSSDSTDPSKYTWSRFEGLKGDDGQSLVSMTREYYMSTSNTAQTGGSWSATPPTFDAAKYLWVRFKAVYKNPDAIAYSEPELDGAWSATLQAIETANQAATSASNASQSAQNAVQQAGDALSKAQDIEQEIGPIKTGLQEAKDAAAEAKQDVADATEQILLDISGSYATKGEMADMEGDLHKTGLQEAKDAAAEAKQDVADATEQILLDISGSYATKGEMADMEGDLQTQITANADGLASKVSNTEYQQNKADIDAELLKQSNALTAAQNNLSALQSAQSEANQKLTKAEADLKAAQDAVSALESDQATTTEQLNAAKSALATAQQAVDKATADVTQAKKDIAAAQGQISDIQDGIDGLTSRVTTAETNITQNSQAINLRATKTEVNTAIQGAKDYADAQIEVESKKITQTVTQVSSKVDALTSQKQETYYYQSTSNTTQTGGSWSTTKPSEASGKYIWMKIKFTFVDGTTSETSPICMTGATGTTGKGVKSTAITYQAGTSGTTAPTGSWSATVPAVSQGQYLWTRTVITYTDNSTSTSYSVSYIAKNGTNGADGVDAFMIVYDSPSGLEFSDTVKSIAITAKIFKGGKELTDAEVNKFGAIKWYQVGVDAAIATGKTLTLTAPKEVYATLEN